MNSDNNRFTEELLSVPPVPDDILPAVRRRIRQRTAVVRLTWALAASLVLSVGLARYTTRSPSATATGATTASAAATQSEIEDELQYVSDFINGTNIENEVSMYALVDPAMF